MCIVDDDDNDDDVDDDNSLWWQNFTQPVCTVAHSLQNHRCPENTCLLQKRELKSFYVDNFWWISINSLVRTDLDLNWNLQFLEGHCSLLGPCASPAFSRYDHHICHKPCDISHVLCAICFSCISFTQRFFVILIKAIFIIIIIIIIPTSTNHHHNAHYHHHANHHNITMKKKHLLLKILLLMKSRLCWSLPTDPWPL